MDLQISDSAQLDSEYMRAGYEQVIPSELGDLGTKYDVSTQGSFGKGESIWIWRRRQGACVRVCVCVCVLGLDSCASLGISLSLMCKLFIVSAFVCFMSYCTLFPPPFASELMHKR